MSITVKFREDRNRWQVDYVIDGKRKRPLFGEKQEAENFARRLRLGLSPEDIDSITIAQAGKLYFESESQQKSASSKSNDKRYINLLYYFMDEFRGIRKLKSVQLDDMEAFREWLSKECVSENGKLGLGNATVNRCLGMMKRFFKKHVQWKNLTESPCVYLDFLDAEYNDRAPMSGDQYLTTLKTCEDWFKPILQFMYLSGAPGSCVARLKWEHVDFQNRSYILFRKKGHKAKLKSVPLPMTDQVFALLVSVRNLWPELDEHVFRDYRGHSLRADRISKEGNEAIKKAGIKGVTLYGLRHALASDLTAANVATEIVRQAMGHSSILTTQRYANKVGLRSIAGAIDTVRGAELVTNSDFELGLKEKEILAK